MSEFESVSTRRLIDLERFVSELLQESKSIGSMRSHSAERDRTTSLSHAFDPTGSQYARDSKEKHTRRAAVQKQDAFWAAALALMRRYRKQEISYTRARIEVAKLLRSHTHDMFMLGVHSTEHTPSARLHPEDHKFIDSAVRSEMQYLNRFFDSVRRGKVSSDNQISNRLRMYADTLFSAYLVGRTLGHPENTLVWWICLCDPTSCDNCRYLHVNSPFTRASLPTTPRAGDTRCLSRCRCKLVYKTVPREVFQEFAEGEPSRQAYLRRLRQGRW